MYSDKNQNEKINLISQLHDIRRQLAITKPKKKSLSKKKKKKTKTIHFKSKELEEIFNSMPKECQDLLR